MKRFPKLYKKTSTGKIQTWEVWVDGNTMHSESGKLGGKMVSSSDTISSGKNIGRSNETTPEEQAVLEAEARWRGKKKKGYIETIDDARSDRVSDLVEGGFIPMLAKTYDKDKKHIVFPCAAQPKLDGVRATYNSGDKIWSRTRKELVGVPHIPRTIVEKDVNFKFPKLDGELYVHEYKDNFEEIVHIVKQKKKPVENHEIVQYHVYDIPSTKPFNERMKDLVELGKMVGKNSPIRIVNTVIIKDEEALEKYYDLCVEHGYEGCMVRNLHCDGYEYKRSKHLQKVKEFQDAEFEIVGVEEGRGKLTGHAGSFICRTPEGNEFNAKLKGKLSDLRQYFTDQDDYIGKILTVQFQGYTNKNNVPRFPVALRFREEGL